MTPSAMMKAKHCACLFAFVLIGINSGVAQKQNIKTTKPAASSDIGSTVLATVGGEPVIYSDVERAFQKNMTRRDTKLNEVHRDTAMEFLRLYTNYRLKVASAKQRGMHNDSAVKADIANNRKLLSETYYFDKVIADSRIAEISKRRTRELHIAIILSAKMNAENTNWDSTASLAKAQDLIRQLQGGADFEKLAREQSDDKETATNGGKLPWLSGGTIIKIVEDEAYALPVGTYSKAPIPSRFGYFIVKVLRSEPRTLAKFRHILLQPKDNRDSTASALFADSLINILKSSPAQQAQALKERGITATGDVFVDLARTYSDDKSSADKGGYLGSAYTRSGGLETGGTRLLPAFEDAVFKLKQGEISPKVRTMFGVHIIRLDSLKTPDDMMERDNARRTYRRMYFEEDKRMVLDSLEKAYGFAWQEPAFTDFRKSVDTTKNSTDTTWSNGLTASTGSNVIYSGPGLSITGSGFADTLHRRLDLRGFSLNREGMDRAMNKITDPIVLSMSTKDMDKKYDDFRALMQEFNDGILLFKVEEQEVWSKLKFDTAEAKTYFDTTSSRWMTEQKYLISEVYVTDENAAKAVRKRISAGEAIGDIAATTTQRDGLREKRGLIGSVGPKTSRLAQVARDSNAVSGKIIGPFSIDKGYSVIRVEGVEPPRQKSFDEALPELAPAYQDALQKRLTEVWLSEVRKTHPVVFNQNNINKVFASTNSPGKSGK